MRVLLVHPKLTDSFWTFSETLALLGKKQLVAPLGIITVAALLPESWQCKFVDANFQEIDTDLWEWTDVVMISAMVAHRDGLRDVVLRAKDAGKRVVVGGPYALSFPDHLREMGVDFIFQGEAESGLDDLVQALLNGSKTGLFCKPSKPDLTESPIPRYDLLPMNAYTCMSVQTARGCPHNCEFCDVVSLYGRKQRYKRPSQVTAELDRLYELGWNETVFVCDDNFVGNKKHSREILAELIQWNETHGKPFGFWTQVTASLGQDLELMNLMTEANFGHVFIGIETPDEETLVAIRKRHNVTNPLLESLRSINENGLSVIGSFILGFDSEKEGASDRICAFVEQAGLPQVMINLLQAPPGSALWDRLERENRLRDQEGMGESIGGGFNFIPARPEKEILEEYVKTIEFLYEPSRYMERAYRYYLAMRPTRKALAEARGEHYAPTQCLPQFKRLDINKQSRVIPGLRLLWRQGVVSSYRFQFWRQLVGIMKSNPSRLNTYLLSAGFGENLFPLRELVRRRLGEVPRERRVDVKTQ